MQTEDYRLGAIGGPAGGCGRIRWASSAGQGEMHAVFTFPPACPRLGNMTGNWFIATYYFGSFGYSRWRPGSRVR